MLFQLLVADSCLYHLAVVVASVRSTSCNKFLMVPSTIRPLMIWSWLLFCAHISEQNLQVYTSSLRVMRKSSNNYPSCWTHQWKFRVPLFHWYDHPNNVGWLILIVLLSFIYLSVRPRFCIIASILLEKHSIKNFCLLGRVFQERYKRLQYDSHWVLHVVKSVPLSTCMSRFGKLPFRKRYT